MVDGFDLAAAGQSALGEQETVAAVSGTGRRSTVVLAGAGSEPPAVWTSLGLHSHAESAKQGVGTLRVRVTALVA